MTENISRRFFFLGSLAAIGCSPVNRAKNPALVSIVRQTDYSGDLTGTVKRILLQHRVPANGLRVVLKPNLVEFDCGRPINTNPYLVSAVRDAFLSIGARSVNIAEGPANRRATLDMAEAAGYFTAVPRFENLFTDLNLDEVSRVRLKKPFSSLTELYLPNTVLNCDLLVSLPKMKTHHWAGATLSMKNHFGIVPGAVYGWPKNLLHWAGIDECVADLHELFPRQFCIVDGIEAMEGNGPLLGSCKKLGLLVAGKYPPAVDAVCCRLMRIDPAKIGYLKLASRRNGRGLDDVTHAGESIEDSAASFTLPRAMEHLRLGRVA